MYPVPILTRDVTGYSISPHTDTSWKGITVQRYLPPDASAPHVGTVFHAKLPDGSLTRRRQMRFVPNTGYAFAVGDDTWHSADEVGPDVPSRDSILLTYFVDAGPLRILRNRSRRFGNFLLNEARHLRYQTVTGTNLRRRAMNAIIRNRRWHGLPGWDRRRRDYPLGD